ncbi:polysaccharide pyruvyl transferase family protein [Candidatus Chloroploca sp. Khr17]|uniref:polysaccharide pyruvyl transferase family protein n=1 Tax=Candidatus Chloroploca sp. Khr17 TaxID=2496869 RepID=UPI00101C93B0|nr:polysaccharide pyruvyl transferase family protein [Candidatus Chloroploca sp. Khr17]
MKRVLLLGADLRSVNNGINALTLGTLTALACRYSDGFHVDILNLGGSAEYEDKLVVQGVPVTVKKHKPYGKSLLQAVFLGSLIRYMPNKKAKVNFKKNNRLVSIVSSADFAIDLSEGDSFSDIYGNKRFFIHFLYKMLPGISGIPLFMFPQTIGPFSNKSTRFLAKRALDQAKIVFTREPLSTQIAKHLMSDRNRLIEASDMAFLMEPMPIKTLPEEVVSEGYVGVNISGLLFYRDKSEQLRWTPSLYQNFMREVIKGFILKYKRQVVIVPHVFTQGSIKHEDDQQASHDLFQQFDQDLRDKIYILDQKMDAQKLKYIISQSDFFVGARMHACIAAISSLVPTVPVSYSHKFEGVLQQLGLENTICSPKRQSGTGEMLKHVWSQYENRELLHNQLVRAVPDAKSRALSSVSFL